MAHGYYIVTIPDSLITFVSKEAVGQGNFRATKHNRTNYIALNLPYATGLVSFVLVWVTNGTTY